MAANSDNLRFILGLKLRTLRQTRGLSLKDVSDAAGVSISYLSEIEQGKKYPKPDKLLALADAFDIPYDELVSLRVADELDPLKEVFSSSFVQEFPFELFGLESQDVFGLVSGQPTEAGALIRTLLEIGRMYDMQVEHFLFAALRSYQQMHDNYFEELETRAAAFRDAQGWAADMPPHPQALRKLLETDHHYTIDTDTLPDHPVLSGFRSVYTDTSDGPVLFVNGDLLPSQRAFIYGRELGYRTMNLTARATTSSWLKVESFEQVLNNYRASYFSGALMMDREAMQREVAALFDRPTWDGDRFLAVMQQMQVTPEMFCYRLSELVPHLFDLGELFFMRFHNEAGTNDFQLTKAINLSQVAVPHGLEPGLEPREHYCRRWPAMQLLRTLARRQKQQSTNATADASTPLLRAQRSHFLDNDAEFFVISAARPLALTENTNSCVSLGFLMTETFKRRVRFWDDPDIPQVDVNLTCERCPLPASECSERTAPPTVYESEQKQERQEEALRQLLEAARAARVE